MVSNYFGGKKLNKMLNPDEAIAIGATIQAGIEKGAQEVSDVNIIDSLPMSIGMSIIDRDRRA